MTSETSEFRRGPFEVVREDDLVMRTRDGTRLCVDLYRPALLENPPASVVPGSPSPCTQARSIGEPYSLVTIFDALFPGPRHTPRRILAWTSWRRRHPAGARVCHYRARENP